MLGTAIYVLGGVSLTSVHIYCNLMSWCMCVTSVPIYCNLVCLSLLQVAANTPSMYSQELFQLSQYLQVWNNTDIYWPGSATTLYCLVHGVSLTV